MTEETMLVAKLPGEGQTVAQFWAEADRIIERRRALKG